jgi:signal transduction histidine kinase
MRRRLVAALVTFVLLAVLAYGIPRAFALADRVRDEDQQRAERTVVLLETLAVAAGDDRQATERLAAVVRSDEALRFVGESGLLFEIGDVDAHQVRATQRLGDRSITLAIEDAAVDRRVAQALLPLLVIGVLIVAAAAVAAVVLARRLSRPFQELAGAADSLGQGHFEVDVPHYGIPEADRLADALRQSGAQLAELLRQERELVATLSHELRTPLTALRLVLEEAVLEPDLPDVTRDGLQAAFAQTDRIAERIDTVLADARRDRDRAAARADLRKVVAAATTHAAARLGRSGRSLWVDPLPAAVLLAPAGLLEEVLAVLLDNAVVHGAGDVWVTVTEERDHVRLRVRDEGTGMSGDVAGALLAGETASAGSAVSSLAGAAERARAVGGRLVVAGDGPTAFDLVLPSKPDERVSGSGTPS